MARRAASEQQIRERLAREHPALCGHYSGYKQINRAREQLKALGVPASELPPYDPACQRAWADLRFTIRSNKKPKVKTETPWPHGTAAGRRKHYAERSRLRSQGVPDYELPPICPACKAAPTDDLEPAKTKGSPARPGPLPGEDAPHGSPERRRYELLLQRRMRAEGQPEEVVRSVLCPQCALAGSLKNRPLLKQFLGS
jgi:hypothetical protein